MVAFPFDLGAFPILNDELAEQGANPQYAAHAHVIHVVPDTGSSLGVGFDTWWDALESEFTLEKQRYDDLADVILREHDAPTRGRRKRSKSHTTTPRGNEASDPTAST